MSSSSTERERGGPASATRTTVDVTMPQMGVSVSEGTIAEWRKQVGDRVEYEEPICLISTDKIDTDLPSPAAGTVTEIVVEEGATVDVGAVLARIETGADATLDSPPSGGGPPTSEAAAATGQTPAPATETPAPEPEPSPRQPERPQRFSREGGRRYSPVVQRIAAEHGVDLEQVPGTGRGGRVRKQDVLAFIEQGGAEAPLHIESPYRPDEPPPERPAPGPPAGAAAPSAPYEPPPAQPLSRMRALIGAHMKRSLETAATCTTWIEVDFSGVERARERLGVTALPIVARATIDALRAFPTLNAWLQDDRHTVHEEVNLGIAVSLGEEGLIVPVVRSAQDLSAEGLAKRIKDVARRARSRQLTPDDTQGGTFTITNPGQFGSIMATPVINQPQVAILDLEAVVKRPVVVTDERGDDSIAIRPMCILGLSWDHRALDGALAARFLGELKRRLEHLDPG